MAHTIKSLSKLLKKSTEDVISILASAGIDGKTIDSEISAKERSLLMANLSRGRSKTPEQKTSQQPQDNILSASNSSVKIQVKKSLQNENENENENNKDSIKIQEAKVLVPKSKEEY